MDNYISERSAMRKQGLFTDPKNHSEYYLTVIARGKPEKENIPLADAIHNDFVALTFFRDDGELTSPLEVPRSVHDPICVEAGGNSVRMENVFDAYAIGKYSPEKQREVLEHWEEMRRIRLEPRYHYLMPMTRLTPAETETVSWLLARINVLFNAPPDGFSESDASLLFRMRTAVADHQPQGEQEQKPKDTGNIFRFIRRR